MSVININILKARFQTGDRPSSKDYIDMIDTLLAGGNVGGGLTADQAVFVGDSGNLISKNPVDARAALGVLSAGTKVAGILDDQIARNHGALVAGQPAIIDSTGWITKTIDQYLSLLGVGTKFAYYSSGTIAKGSPPLTTVLTHAMTFAQPSGASHWTEVDLWGFTYLKSETDPANSGIAFYWNCGTLLDTAVGVSADAGATAGMGCLGVGDGVYAIATHYKGVVPVAIRETFPLVMTAKLALTADKDGNNWNVAGKATAR